MYYTLQERSSDPDREWALVHAIEAYPVEGVPAFQAFWLPYDTAVVLVERFSDEEQMDPPFLTYMEELTNFHANVLMQLAEVDIGFVYMATHGMGGCGVFGRELCWRTWSDYRRHGKNTEDSSWKIESFLEVVKNTLELYPLLYYLFAGNKPEFEVEHPEDARVCLEMNTETPAWKRVNLEWSAWRALGDSTEFSSFSEAEEESFEKLLAQARKSAK